jgi:hypothetical protein
MRQVQLFDGFRGVIFEEEIGQRKFVCRRKQIFATLARLFFLHHREYFIFLRRITAKKNWSLKKHDSAFRSPAQVKQLLWPHPLIS